MGLFDIFNNNNAKDAAAAQTAGINAGYNQLSDQFNTGRGTATTNYMAGLAPFQQNYSAATPGVTAYGNATGANGPAGNAAATAAFWANPGTQAAIDTGSQNVMRQAAAAGGGDQSGATLAALQRLGQNTAAGNWQNYVSNLQPYLNYSQGAATGIGGLYSGLGSLLNQSYQNQGNAAYGAQTSIGNANANADLANNAASANMWGGILGGVGAGAKMFGGF